MYLNRKKKTRTLHDHSQQAKNGAKFKQRKDAKPKPKQNEDTVKNKYMADVFFLPFSLANNHQTGIDGSPHIRSHFLVTTRNCSSHQAGPQFRSRVGVGAQQPHKSDKYDQTNTHGNNREPLKRVRPAIPVTQFRRSHNVGATESMLTLDHVGMLQLVHGHDGHNKSDEQCREANHRLDFHAELRVVRFRHDVQHPSDQDEKHRGHLKGLNSMEIFAMFLFLAIQVIVLAILGLPRSLA